MATNNSIYRAQRGQALTEFTVVGLFLLVPLFLIVPVIAKVMSQNQDVEMAARYAAWERTVWYEQSPDRGLSGYEGAELTFKSDEEIAREVDARIYAESTQPIRSNADTAYSLDPFSRRQNGNQAAMIAQKENGDGHAMVTTTNEAPGGIVGLTDSVADVIQLVSQFDMPDKGLVNAQASVELMDLHDVFGDIASVEALQLHGNSAIYTESWSAGGRAHAEHRIQGLLPQQFLDNGLVDKAQDLLSEFPIADELQSDCLVIGKTTVEPLPEHRLVEFDGVEGGGGSSCSL